MGQEFFINSQELENKIRQLLPSQGWAGAGFDLSASTQIVPIIDLTESAEGSNVRADLQSALSFNDVTVFEIAGSSNTDIITTTGYWRIFGNCNLNGIVSCNIILKNSSGTEKAISDWGNQGTSASSNIITFDFNVFLGSGDVVNAKATNSGSLMRLGVKQLASIDGTLTTPT